MAEDNGGVQVPKWLTTFGVSLAVVLAGGWFLIGANSKISELQATVANVEADVDALAEVSDQIEVLELQLEEAEEQLAELQEVRDDIAAAICEALDGQSPCPDLGT